MNEGDWGPWRNWELGRPPVPRGTVVDAYMRARPISSRPLWRGRLVFTVTTGDSFRPDRDRVDPGVMTLVVTRYRVRRGGEADSAPRETQVGVPQRPVEKRPERVRVLEDA